MVAPVRLYSSLRDNTSIQSSSRSGNFTNDQLVWYELLSVYLPANFRTDAAYRYRLYTHSTNDPHPAASQRSPTSATTRASTSSTALPERRIPPNPPLYDSRSSSGGNVWSLTNALAVDYTELIPVGGSSQEAACASSDYQQHRPGQHRQSVVPGIPVPGSFTLQQQNVALGSIIVNLQCTQSHPCPPPMVPNQIVPLTENTDYTVTSFDNGTTVAINVITLPEPLVVPGTYDFLVSYSAHGGNFELRTNTYGSTASVELFDNFLTPYFSYVAIRTNVLSGVFPSPVDSTTYTTGLLITRGPVRVRGEYQDSQWQISPYQAWRVDVQYVSAINPTTSVYATAGYLNKYYPQGTSEDSTTAFTDESESVSASVQKQLFARNLFVSAGGSYSHLQGQINGDSYSTNGSLLWKVGRVDLTLGASAYGADTSGGSVSSGTDIISTRRDHQFVYMKLRRRLF